jgi:hypothetical protein
MKGRLIPLGANLNRLTTWYGLRMGAAKRSIYPQETPDGSRARSSTALHEKVRAPNPRAPCLYPSDTYISGDELVIHATVISGARVIIISVFLYMYI